jgi:hypothetical protein
MLEMAPTTDAKTAHVRLPKQRAGIGAQSEETDMAYIDALPATSGRRRADC